MTDTSGTQLPAPRVVVSARFQRMNAERLEEYQEMFDSFVNERSLDLDSDTWSAEDSQIWEALVTLFNARWADAFEASGLSSGG